MQVPFARQLAIWFVIGIGISLAPGISLLGHLGGFVPGVLLGIYYELRYSRKADIFHHLSAGVLAAIVLGLCLYAAYPWHRGNLYAGQALAAYELGNLERGDALLRQAKSRGTSTGGQLLVTHLELWRENNAISPRNFGKDVLRWPLTHARPEEQIAGQPFLFLNPRMIVSDDIQLDPPESTPATNGP
jgi:hypothetical protein